jgi:hypothetical protein
VTGAGTHAATSIARPTAIQIERIGAPLPEFL